MTQKNLDAVNCLPPASLSYYYNFALEKFNALKLVHPPADDEQQRKDFFSFCEEVCADNPSAPQEYVLSFQLSEDV